MITLSPRELASQLQRIYGAEPLYHQQWGGATQFADFPVQYSSLSSINQPLTYYNTLKYRITGGMRAIGGALKIARCKDNRWVETIC